MGVTPDMTDFDGSDQLELESAFRMPCLNASSESVVDDLPQVSIGVPVFNAERWLPRALDSLLAQDHRRLEIIICDNASDDGTMDICREYARRSAEIRVYENATNLGIWQNFGRVLSLASGEYFMWAAADDRWTRTFVSRTVAALEAHPEAGVCMTAVRRVRDDGTVQDDIRLAGRKDPSKLSPLRLAFATAQKEYYFFYIYGLYRRRLLEAAFQRLPQVKGADHLFVTQIALATRFRYIDELLYIRQVHQKSTAERYADEDLGTAYGDRFGDWKRVAAAGPFLLGSKVIPLRLKPLVPLIWVGFAIPEIRFASLGLLSRLLGATVGAQTRARLGRIARRIIGTRSS